MPRGYDRALYILLFDHRGPFETNLFGWNGELNEAQTAEIATVKRVIFDGFKAAIAGGVPKAKAGILVDEQFGAAILAMRRQRASVSRTDFWASLTAWRATKATREEAVAEIARRYRGFVDIFEKTGLQMAGPSTAAPISG